MKIATVKIPIASLISLLWMLAVSGHVSAQHYMNIRMTDGSTMRYAVNTVDSVWFDKDEEEAQEELPYTLGDGYIFYKDGKFYKSVSWRCSDYILIDPDRIYYLHVHLPGYNAGYAFYDANKKFISGANKIEDDLITSPSNACYLRFSTPEQHEDEVAFYLLKERLTFSWRGGYIYYKNGINYNSTVWKYSDYITIEADKYYYLNIPLPGYNAGLAFYDSNKVYICGVNIIQNNLIKSPVGARYIRFSSQSQDIEKAKLYSLEELGKKEPISFEQNNGYIYYKSGAYYNSASWKCSNFVTVGSNKRYFLNVPLPGYNAGYAFYDNSKNYLGGANIIASNTIISPEGANYLRFSIPIQFADSVLFYPLDEGSNISNNDNHPEEVEGFIIRNNNQNELSLLPSGSKILDTTGAVLDLVSNYGNNNQVLSIPVKYTPNSKMVVRFRVKFNEDLNKRSSHVNYNAENPNLLNFFTMSGSGHKISLGVLPDIFINPVTKASHQDYGQVIGLQGTTKIKAVSANNTINTDVAHVAALTFDNYRSKTLTGGRLLSIRWLDNNAANADVCISNNGNTLTIYHSISNSVIYQYNLASYPTLTSLYDALSSNTQLDVKLYQETNKTPADMIEFSGIKLVSERNVVDGAGMAGVNYPKKTVYDNAPLYILDKIDDGWHTVEIAADRGIDAGVFCCCVDGTYLYAGSVAERISYYDGDTILYYFGGDENGTKINCTIKDIEIKYDNIEQTEILSYNSATRAQIISDWHPKVYVLEGHNFSDTELGGQSADRMNQIFRALVEKGYVPITLNELRHWVVDGTALHKRMFYAIYDDYQYDVYINSTLKNLHDTYNVKPGLAEITSRNCWDYEGTRYNVSDINDSMVNIGWIPLSHTRHQDHNRLGYEDLVTAIANDISDLSSFHIPKVGLVWPGGQANIMCHEIVKENGWSMAFDIARNGGYYAMIMDGVKRCDNPMMLPRFVISNRFPLSSILQEIK